MKRIRSYQSFRESRPIKEEFIGKFVRNITGANKKRIQMINDHLSKFTELKSAPKIEDIPYLHLDRGDSGIVKKVVDDFNKKIESGQWKKELSSRIQKESGKIQPEFISILSGWILENPDFSKVEEMSDDEFSKFLRNLTISKLDQENLIRSIKMDIREKTLVSSLSDLVKSEDLSTNRISEEEFQEPETKLWKYYSSNFSHFMRPLDFSKSKLLKNGSIEVNEGGEFSDFIRLMKSFICFLGKEFKSYEYDKTHPERFEEILGKDYISKIDFDKKISELENIKTLKEEVEKVIKWKNNLNKKSEVVKKYTSIKDSFDDYYSKSDLSKLSYKSEYETTGEKNFLGFINFVLEKFGDMSIKQFFDYYNSTTGKSEKFTTSEDYINGYKIYKIKEGCGKVYHGGKIPPTDLEFLFREQGGMYGCKMIPAAYLWPTVIGSRKGISMLTKRVYELSVRPDVKMVDDNPGGADSGSEGGLKDERQQYYQKGIAGMANKWYMNVPNGEVPKEIPETGRNITEQTYKTSCLSSEVVIFDRKSLVDDIRIVPFKEVLESFEKLGVTGDNRYTGLKNSYSTWRDMVWTLESVSPNNLSSLEEFSTIKDPQGVIKENISALINAHKNTKITLKKAPDDQKVDDLVERLSKISIGQDKFQTMLDFIIDFMGKFR